MACRRFSQLTNFQRTLQFQNGKLCYNSTKQILRGILVENRKKSDIAIGKNMAYMRTKFSLTQKDIAQVVGVNVSTYNHYELGTDVHLYQL